jgi:hypothetical protein
MRIPQEDLEAARPLINELMEEMRFTIPAAMSQFACTKTACVISSIRVYRWS